jgi:hypothetical protein
MEFRLKNALAFMMDNIRKVSVFNPQEKIGHPNTSPSLSIDGESLQLLPESWDRLGEPHVFSPTK